MQSFIIKFLFCSKYTCYLCPWFNPNPQSPPRIPPKRPLLCNSMETSPFQCVFGVVILGYSLCPKDTRYCKAAQRGASAGAKDPCEGVGCFRASESALPCDTGGQGLVENHCTMSSLLTPISLVPKLKKTPDEKGKGAHSTRTHQGIPPAALQRFVVSHVTMSWKHSWKKSRCPHSIMQTMKARHREAGGRAQLGAAARAPGTALGSGPRAHCSPVSQAPSQPDNSQLTRA